MFVVGIVSIVGLGSGLAALGVDEDEHQDLEENLRVLEVITYLVVVYLSILILGHVLLISLPAYIKNRKHIFHTITKDYHSRCLICQALS